MNESGIHQSYRLPCFRFACILHTFPRAIPRRTAPVWTSLCCLPCFCLACTSSPLGTYALVWTELPYAPVSRSRNSTVDDRSAPSSGKKSGSRGLHSGGNPLDPKAVTTRRVESASTETIACRDVEDSSDWGTIQRAWSTPFIHCSAFYRRFGA